MAYAANLTQGTPPKPYGRDGRKVYLPQAATAQVYQGAMVAVTSDGSVVTGTTAGSGACMGIAEFDQLGGSTDGAVRMSVWTDKVFCMPNGVNAVSDSTPFGTILFMESDNTVGTGAPGQQIAGRFYGFEDDGTVRVYFSSQGSWNDGAADAPDGGAPAFKARALLTLPDAYTGTGTGTLTETTASSGLGTADGVTLAVGDVVFVQPGDSHLTAAKDSGPWVVLNLGSASVQWILTRPSWWQHGAGIQQAQTIDIGGEGTKFRGGSWRTFCGKGKIVDTDDPAFYVGRFVEQVTFAGADAGAHTYNPSVGVYDAVHSAVMLNLTLPGGTMTAAVALGADAITPGYTNTATMTLQAYSAAFAANTAAGTYKLNVLVTNW